MFVLLYFAVTLFTSATLLFLVQPMIGKMILPLLGGTPAVWNTCMVFFQAVLLAGYAYTHFVSTRLSRRSQLLLQAAILVTPFVFGLLPFSLGAWTPPADSNPVLSVLWILSLVVGVPFFIVSTTAPLLQKWFGFTDHPAAKDPYFLYGASNLGSMLALVLYPVLMEPSFALPGQTVVWTFGYGLFAALVLGCIAFLLLRTPAGPPLEVAPEPLPPQPAAATETAIAPRARPGRLKEPEPARSTSPDPAEADVSWLRRLRWIALAAVPSSLMLSLSTYMTTDIAAIPLLWIIPLAIYLATFIFVFARWPVGWTAPRTTTDTSGRLFFGIAVIFAAVAAGVVIHLMFSRFADPFVPGPSHVMYGAALLGAFLLLLGRDQGAPIAAVFIGIVALATGFAIHLFMDDYRNLFLFGPSHILYAVVLFSLFAGWVSFGLGSPHEFVLFFQPCFLLFLVLYIVAEVNKTMWLEIFLHVASFAFVTLLCHGELARDRPSARHLTDFYLCMSVGGVVGGLFNVFVAPFVFRTGLVEYPLVMVFACLLRPNMVGKESFIPGDSHEGKRAPIGYALDLALPLLIGIAVYYIVRIDSGMGGLGFLHNWDPRWDPETMARPPRLRQLVIVLPIVAGLALALRPVRFGLTVGVLWLLVGMHDDAYSNWVFRDRGFFGLVKVKVVGPPDTGTPYSYNTMIHGGIDHGRQHLDPAKRHEPAAYFHPLTGIGQVFMKLSWPNTPVPPSLGEFFRDESPYTAWGVPSARMPARLVGFGTDPWTAVVACQEFTPHATPYNEFRLSNQRFPASLVGTSANPWSALVDLHSEPPYAVVGLGTGTLAAFAKPYQAVDIYEIDPLVLRLSTKVGDQDPPFTYLEDAKARGAKLNVILGDGRLKIKDAPDNWYHVICLDAFASDAIPVHLLTVEAIELYLKKLAPGGVLVFNTTNRYVRLNPVLKDTADKLDLECLALGNWYTKVIPEQYGTDFVMLRRNAKAIAKLGGPFSGGPPLEERLDTARYNSLMANIKNFHTTHPEAFQSEVWSWRPWRAPDNHDGKLWTDSYSNLLGVLDLGS